MTSLCVAALQVLLAVPVGEAPVRFGHALPEVALAKGLRLDGPGRLQWRRLPLPVARSGDELSDARAWVELAILAPSGVARVVAGGDGPCEAGRGPVFVREQLDEGMPFGGRRRTVWRWSTGDVDECCRDEFRSPWLEGGEVFTVGEARTTWSEAALSRARPLLALGRSAHAQSGLLPVAGKVGEPVRQRLREVLHCLPELAGVRGAGDFVRSGEVITNNEFDTAYALLRCACAFGDATTLALARRAAEHLVDRDLDLRTGLPFRHGQGHRTGVPEAGHVWLRGLLWVALLTADDDLLQAARNVARALAGTVPMGEGRQECARDYAWPLAELEAVLALGPDAPLERAADRLAASIARRFDASLHTFRFGEGELGEAAYLERAWLTGGLVVPALLAHLRRRPNAALAEHVADAQRQLVEQLGKARRGIPTHWSWYRGRLVHEKRVCEVAAAGLMLEGVPCDDLRRLVQRAAFRASLGDVPRRDDPDLATSFTLLARNDWVWR
ncbi:MAG: hypothetical protein H6838_17980 [Planctomycetes bacterium]|nr:hypothetical protein [Planctomycetota bacterium]